MANNCGSCEFWNSPWNGNYNEMLAEHLLDTAIGRFQKEVGDFERSWAEFESWADWDEEEPD